MPACNSFPFNTIGVTQQQVACLGPKVANIIDHEIPEELFLLTVIDMLDRMAELTSYPNPIADLEPCDVAENLRLAYCATHDFTPSFPINIAQLQGIIVAMINDKIC